MASTGEQRDGVVEHEMNNHQRGLVDTCLEERQFESAVAVMEQLRSSNYKPPTSHIQQLVYIALHSIQSSATSNKMIHTDNLSSGKTPSTPPGTAVMAAHRLLMSFALTNSPETIARALPCYNDLRDAEHSLGVDDSIIWQEASCIPKARSCWSILSEGFTKERHEVPTSREKGNKRLYESEELVENISSGDDIIGKNSWPVLDWLLVLFEQDELLQKARGSGRFSKLLLRQIPYPRSGGDARWDTAIPVRIVFHCLGQADLRRRTMGLRLMTLLINLSSTVHLDLPMFVASVFSCLTAAELEKLPILFTGLMPSAAVHKFKVTLCQKFLSNTTDIPSHNGRPKAQARAQPRALRSVNSPIDVTIKSAPTGTGSLSHQSKHQLPDYCEIQRLMETTLSTPLSRLITPSLLPRIKFELMNSYGALQSEAPMPVKDAEWFAALHSGTMTNTLDLGFPPDNSGENHIFCELLRGIMCTW